jgi:hypothetical protein
LILFNHDERVRAPLGRGSKCAEWYISDEPLDAERIIEAGKKSETSLVKSNNPAST